MKLTRVACPFCSSAGPHSVAETATRRHYVHCSNCLADGPLAADPESAVQLWARRVQTQSSQWHDEWFRRRTNPSTN